MRVLTGRVERRIAKTQGVELVPLKGPAAKVEGVTENVSPRGARVITDSVCAPGKLERLNAPNEHANLPGRVIYCHPAGEGRFAVGLRLDVRVEKWQKPRKR